MQHISCKYFDELLRYLESEHPGFTLNRLADDLGCTTNRILRIRKGDGILTMHDLEVLRKKYSVNLLWLTDGLKPYKLTRDLQVVSEPTEEYKTDLKRELEILKELCRSKDDVIALLRQRLGEEQCGVKEKSA